MKTKVIQLHERAPERALDALNRLTGLKFSHWPESLAPRASIGNSGPTLAADRGEPLERLGS